MTGVIQLIDDLDAVVADQASVTEAPSTHITNKFTVLCFMLCNGGPSYKLVEALSDDGPLCELVEITFDIDGVIGSAIVGTDSSPCCHSLFHLKQIRDRQSLFHLVVKTILRSC